MDIKFHCSVCRDVREKLHRSLSEFCYEGYDDGVVFWVDAVNSIPQPLENGSYMRLESCPAKGEQKIVELTCPFTEDSETKFWSLYMPPLSYADGWDVHPDEIEKSAFVQCKIIELMEITNFRAWAKVEIVEVISFRSVLYQIVERQEDDFLNNIYDSLESYQVVVFGNWVVVTASAQGDLGYTMLIKIDEYDIPHLVCFTEFGIHCCAAYVGNVVLMRETLDIIKKRDENT